MSDPWSRLVACLKVVERPLIHKPEVTGANSRYTKPPPLQDKHIAEGFVLKHTKVRDDLLITLARHAEDKIQTMQSANATHPPEHLLTQQRCNEVVACEEGVRAWYGERAKTWCNIAAALGLQDGDWKWNMLYWSTELRPHYALADGAVKIVGDIFFDRLKEDHPHIDSKARQQAVRQMLHERTSDDTIISWEFKNLLVGDEEVMKKILNVLQTNSFRWTSCDDKNCTKHEMQYPTVGNDVFIPREETIVSLSELPPPMKRQKLGKGRKDPLEMKAHHIIQQIWGQACIKDLTYIVLHSGNYELICMRHRGSQTLYCSPLLERCNTPLGYGLIQVGLYLAAIDDAVGRFGERDDDSRVNEAGGGDDGDEDDCSDEDNGGDEDDRGGEDDRGNENYDNSAAGQGNARSPDTAGAGAGISPTVSTGCWSRRGREHDSTDELEDWNTCFDCTVYRNAEACVRLKYGIYDSICPAVFHRQVEPLPLDLHHCCPFQDSFSVLLTSEISRNEGTVVHGGVVTIGTKKDPATRPIIMKSGFNEDKRLIEAEYHIYQLLDRERVPASHVYGLFRDRDPDGATAILMDYTGTQINQVPSGLSPAQQLSFCELLQRIHRAGILHNDIAKRNLLVTGTGEAVIIDFGSATVVNRNEQEAFDDEMSQLRSILYDRESTSCTQVVV